MIVHLEVYLKIWPIVCEVAYMLTRAMLALAIFLVQIAAGIFYLNDNFMFMISVLPVNHQRDQTSVVHLQARS